MRLSLLVSVLLLSTLFCEAQGIRLVKSSLGHYKIQEDSADLIIKRSNGGVGEVILCRDGQCSGHNRNLMTKTTSTSTTTSKNNQKNEGNKSSNEGFGVQEENVSVRSSPVSFHRDVGPEHYPDILDIAGMDYSPAKRKPPTHN